MSPVCTSTITTEPERASCCRIASPRLAVGIELQPKIQRQEQVVAVLGARQQKLLDRVARQIAQHALGAGFAGEDRVVGPLDALEAPVVDVGAANEVRGHFAGGKEAVVFRLEVNTRNAERANATFCFGFHAPGDVGKAAPLLPGVADAGRAGARHRLRGCLPAPLRRPG